MSRDESQVSATAKNHLSSAQWLGVILATGLLIRVVALWATAPTRFVNDEISYFMLAKQISLGAEVADAEGRAPGVVFFYAALFKMFGGFAYVARIGNVALSTVSLVFVYMLGRRFAGTRAGLGAAAIAALYPGFIGFSHSLWSETLYIFFELFALVLLASHRERRGWLRLMGAGAFLGMGALTREVGLFVAVLCAACLVYDSRPRWRVGALRAALTMLMCLAVVLPWSLHLRSTTGHFALITGSAWFNLYVSNVRAVRINGKRVEAWDSYQLLGATRSEREAAARPIALTAVWNALPWWPFTQLSEFRNLLAPDSFVVERLRTPTPEEEPEHVVHGTWRYTFSVDAMEHPQVREALIVVVVLAYLVVLLAGVAGLVLCRHPGAAQILPLFVAFILGHVLPPLATFALTRFRLPLMPIMAIGAAPLLLELRRTLRDSSWPRLVVAYAVVAAAAVAIAAGNVIPSP